MEIVSFSRYRTFQQLKYLYIVLIVILVGMEFGGRFGGYSIYKKYDAPIWLYLITIIAIIVLFVMLLDSIFSPKYKTGELKIDSEQLIVTIKSSKKIYLLKECIDMKLVVNYAGEELDNSKMNYQISWDSKGGKVQYDIILNNVEEKLLRSKILHLTQTGKRL